MTGKQEKSLTLTIGGSESIGKDEVSDDLVVGQKTADSEPVLQQSVRIAMEATMDADDG